MGRLATIEVGGVRGIQASAGVLSGERPAERRGVLMLIAEPHKTMPLWTRKGMDATRTWAYTCATASDWNRDWIPMAPPCDSGETRKGWAVREIFVSKMLMMVVNAER